MVFCFSQQDEKSRHLAEKRQIRIELKEHNTHMEENGVTMLPSANRSHSVDPINYGDPVSYSYGRRYECDTEGSICSSRSSNSGMTSLSVRTTGNLIRPRPSSSRSHLYYGTLKKGLSTPDIRVLGKMYCEANMSSKSQRISLRRHSKTSLTRCSQSSLDSVREVCNKYQVFDIPLEYKLRQQAKRSSKYSDRAIDSTIYSIPDNSPRKNTTVEFNGNATEGTCRHSLRISGNKTMTKAIIHTRTPSLKDLSISTINGNSLNGKDNHSIREANIQRDTILAADSEIIHNAAAQQSIDSTSYYLQAPSDYIASRETNSQCEFKTSRNVQYHDPTSRSKLPEGKQSLFAPVRPERPIITISKPVGIIVSGDNGEKHKPSLLLKTKPQILPKPSSSIYATVNKSYFKAVSKAVVKVDVNDTICDVNSLEDDEDDAVSTERQYARLCTFKGASNDGMPIPVITISRLSSETTQI